MGAHFEVWGVFFVLAALVGFFADRASICTVKAVEEILTTRRAFMILSFAKTVLWVIGIGIWLVWWLGAASPQPLAFRIGWSGVLGGVLFGIGAVLNNGCAISTLTRLGNGNLGMVVSLSGFAAGVVTYELSDRLNAGIEHIPAAPWFELDFRSATVLGVLLTVWMSWEIIRLYRTAPTGRWRKLLLSRPIRLSTAAAIIGVSNGIIYANLGTWSYTHTLRQGVGQVLAPTDLAVKQTSDTILWTLFLALIVGVLISALINRRFVLAWRPKSTWHGYFWGGVLMGLGAALVPGGNDVLLLNAIPGLSPHALPSYLAMLAGIWITLMVWRWRGGELQAVNCSGDQCYAPEAYDS